MQNPYDFQFQVKVLTQMVNTNIKITQTCNNLLKDIDPKYISKVVKKLKNQYNQQYKNIDDQKLTSIKSLLNLIDNQKMSNVDQLFVELADEVNDYYKKQLIQIQKTVPFQKQCQICQKFISNCQQGLKSHFAYCQNKKMQKQREKKKTKPKKDTQIQYYKRQNMRTNDNIFQQETKKQKKGKKVILKQKIQLKQKTIDKKVQNTQDYRKYVYITQQKQDEHNQYQNYFDEEIYQQEQSCQKYLQKNEFRLASISNISIQSNDY